mmetsp:Transcript_113119/g.314907  ORF Transcript_113119/g.314907 Transcript_113119/m.314907 type:complete len:204 (+) Transcript_113119:96-707(+)
MVGAPDSPGCPARAQDGWKKCSRRFWRLRRRNASRTLHAVLPAVAQSVHAVTSNAAPTHKQENNCSLQPSTLTVTTESHWCSSTSVGSSKNTAGSSAVVPNRTPTETLNAVVRMATPASRSAKKAALPATAPTEPSAEQTCKSNEICVRGYCSRRTICSSCRCKWPSSCRSVAPGRPTRGRTSTSRVARSKTSRARDFGSRGP